MMQTIIFYWIFSLFNFYKIINSATVLSNLQFEEEPSDLYLTENSPAILKCKILNARVGFFRCNNQWSQDPVTSNIIQIGNKQILLLEQRITKSQLDGFKKDNSDSFWCTCQGWLDGPENKITSRKAIVKLAYIEEYFEWEPMTTSGLIGKSAEIRCLSPRGDPKPSIQWLKNGTPIKKSNKRIIISHEGSLLINEVRINDSANYTCVAKNIAGVRSSDPAFLTVTENKGWNEWSPWTKCDVKYNDCGEGVKKRTRRCLNPPTINNAIGCEGFPEQQITCYKPCSSHNVHNNPNITFLKLEKKIVKELVEEEKWSEWSPWSMICSSDCTRSRKRQCTTFDLEKCKGKDAEIDNCPYYCEPEKVVTGLHPTKQMEKYNLVKHLIPPSIFLTCFFVFVLILSIALKRQFCASKKNTKKSKAIHSAGLNEQNHPIYYSIQPDYNQEHYMDICTLLPLSIQNNCANKQINQSQMKQQEMEYIFSNDRHKGKPRYCDSAYGEAHNNMTPTGSNCTNSTTSSKLKLTSSPSDSLAKQSTNKNCNCCSTLMTHNSNNTHEAILNFDEDYENNTFKIMKLINDRKNAVRPAKSLKKCTNKDSSSFDLFEFDAFKSGGLIEIPKYSMHILIGDNCFDGEISAGVFRSNIQNVLHLDEDQTVLSSIVTLKTDSFQKFNKPVIISFDHAAQFAETDWETSIFYKSLSSSVFEETDQKTNDTLYSHIESNRCYVMTERDGMYALVGRPKKSIINQKPLCCVKEMKYALFEENGVVRIVIFPNIYASTEKVAEMIQGTSANVFKMPTTFELGYPSKGMIGDAYLNFEVNLKYNDKLASSDLSVRKIKMSDVWHSTKDYFEIDIECSNKSASLQKDFTISLQLEDKILFLYSKSNNLSLVENENLKQHEFYSSVSINPVFIPLKIENLLDDYVSKCFKMSTLKKNDWSLFANLIKCDRNAHFFTKKQNSFELVISLWLMINLSRTQSDSNSHTLKYIG